MKLAAGKVVGAYFFPTSQFCLGLIEEGDALKLEADPSNNFDEYAITINWQGVPIGYVPNKGTTCPECANNCRADMKHCPKCGSKGLIRKGLAYRLHLLEVLDQEYVCFVSKVESGSDIPITFEIWLATNE